MTKINYLFNSTPSGVVMLSSWLTEKEYSLDLQKRYKKSNWLSSIGTGAVIRHGDKVDYYGAIYALQEQAGMSVHVGGRSALSVQGKGQYIDMASGRVVLFGGGKEKLPAWFKKYDWGVKLDYFATSFLPADMGLVDLDLPNFSVRISGPARAMMECLYLAPRHQEFYECYELMEGLNTLRPKSVQKLLEKCSSVKVKRLFLYLAEKCGHDWVGYLDLGKIDLGSGKRSLVKNGGYISKYQITVPKELLETPFNYLMNNRRRILDVFRGKNEKLINKEIPFLFKAWVLRDGAVSVEISEFFSQLLMNNPSYIMKMFSQHSQEFEAWLENLEHFMFTEFVAESSEELISLKVKISASLKRYLDTVSLVPNDQAMAERILERVEGISIRVID